MVSVFTSGFVNTETILHFFNLRYLLVHLLQVSRLVLKAFKGRIGRPAHDHDLRID